MLDIYQNVPVLLFILLIPVGLSYIFFGIRIYKYILGVLGFLVGGFVTYHITRRVIISAIAGAVTALVAVLLQFIFMLIVAGLTFGAVAFAAMIMYFRSYISLIGGVLVAALGIYAAIKLFRFMIILTTSAIGSAAVTFSVLVLKDHRGISKPVDLTTLAIDDFQMVIGFAGLLIVGVIIQGISWGRQKDEEE